MQRVRGFTLVEIMVVLVLIALLLGVASFGFSQTINAARVRAAGKDLVAALRYTRGHAIVSGEEQALELDIEARTYTAPERSAEELPGKMELRLVTAAEEQTSQTSGRIRFYPDGSSTGGKVRLISGEREWQVQVGWLTGEVRLREATP
ncbi:MAG: GspH/FimT family pseudopilin [Xanthomonadales bacterium]|nr:GspH/FimT family pseudopilin [Xanthomonadales bacterium]